MISQKLLLRSQDTIELKNKKLPHRLQLHDSPSLIQTKINSVQSGALRYMAEVLDQIPDSQRSWFHLMQ